MKYLPLGSSDIKVSNICLGSMTWGVQNTQQDADQQIELALNKGINFIDTAELYPVPPKEDKYGDTERIIGHWLAKNAHRRQEVVLASKIAGRGLSYIRNAAGISAEAVIASVDASLQRLNTDYIDLYQLHWPNRTNPHFANHRVNQVQFSDVDRHRESEQMLQVLQALDECIKQGKILHCGLSNETPWGISEYIKLSEKHALPRMVSIQNEFNLLHNKDWPYLIETCIHNDIAYLPWSPLAGGMLTGKYLNGAIPKGSRWSMQQRNGLFRNTKLSEQAVAEYVNLAKRFAITPAQLALAWCAQVDGVTSTIIGATNLEQLTENITAFDLPWQDDINYEVTQLLTKYPAPF